MSTRLEPFTVLPSGFRRSWARVDGRRIPVTVGRDVEPHDEVAVAAVRLAVDRSLEIARYCADQLVEIRNDGWSEDGEVVDWRDFVRLLSLRAIEVHDDGSRELTYAEGGLFRGHTIIVEVDADGRLVDAQLGH